MTSRIKITEAVFEGKVDHLVQRRLDSDQAYLHAFDSETQSRREAEITAEVEDELSNRYEVV